MTPASKKGEKKSKTCEWSYDETMDAYETDCDQAFCVNEGTPKENDMRFCCYCGKKLVERKNK